MAFLGSDFQMLERRCGGNSNNHRGQHAAAAAAAAAAATTTTCMQLHGDRCGNLRCSHAKSCNHSVVRHLHNSWMQEIKIRGQSLAKGKVATSVVTHEHADIHVAAGIPPADGAQDPGSGCFTHWCHPIVPLLACMRVDGKCIDDLISVYNCFSHF